MVDETRFGTHSARIERETVLIRWVGSPELEDMLQLSVRLARVIAEHKQIFIIHDMRYSGLPSTETRQWIAKWLRDQPVAGIATFGANLAVRVLQTLITRAADLVGRQSAIPTAYVANEAEALAWVAARRRGSSGAHESVDG